VEGPPNGGVRKTLNKAESCDRIRADRESEGKVESIAVWGDLTGTTMTRSMAGLGPQ